MPKHTSFIKKCLLFNIHCSLQTDFLSQLCPTALSVVVHTHGGINADISDALTLGFTSK